MSIERIISTNRPSLYDSDFALWLEQQRDALRRADASRLDYTNLAEEIEDLGKNLKREVSSRLETLIAHLIKLSVSNEERPKAGWKATVREQRRQLEKLFADSPSLRRYADEIYQDASIAAKSDAYAALIDYEPHQAEAYEAAIRAGWDMIEIELVLEHGRFFEIKETG